MKTKNTMDAAIMYTFLANPNAAPAPRRRRPRANNLLPCGPKNIEARINWATRGHGLSLTEADDAAAVIQRRWRRHNLDGMDFHDEVRWRREVLATRCMIQSKRIVSNIKYSLCDKERHDRLVKKLEDKLSLMKTMLLDRKTCMRYRGLPALSL